MDDFLTLAAKTHAERLALLDGDQRISYAELNLAVATLAARLTVQGIRRGQRVAVLLDRSLDAVNLVHALVRIGASLVPLNPRLTADEMQYQVENAACDWILRTTQDAHLDSSTHVDDLPRNAPGLNLVGALELDNEFGILFTSGTTGQPKGARLLWKNIYASAKASALRLGTHPNDRWLLTLPLYHIGGLSILLRSALYGTAVILPNFENDQFDLNQLQKRMYETETTMVSLVPTMLHRLLSDEFARQFFRRSNLPVGDETASSQVRAPRRISQEFVFPESLRLILLGGAAASPQLLERAFAQNLPVATTYGLTECASQVATATPNEARRKPGSVGKPLAGIRVDIRDDDGQKMPTGEIGNVYVSGDVVMFGYLHQTQIHEWFRTGDLGYLDEDGDLFIIQRRSDLIISGGENIYPAEVEAVLLEHPAIAEACVVGIPDEQWGQRVAVAIVVRTLRAQDRTSFDETMPEDEQNAHRSTNIQDDGATHHRLGEEIITFCRQHLAGYKIPRRIALLDNLPQTASGKLKRQEIVKLLENPRSFSLEHSSSMLREEKARAKVKKNL
ncbi:MAG: AMP-binding protein [Anaerolineae bacterium]|jgi:o-succinylbenzoate---CoA ligase|nr:AMP-binding protein [Anaerolineae bacterium]MBT7070911.1 AMP-binding protein [Anaerolineae bacterium]MBT7324337.1 AMP-binding protein [Anaerolineae bacterium]